jgi:alkylation response protein AidB-like acyl-CoA dehydrogenase
VQFELTLEQQKQEQGLHEYVQATFPKDLLKLLENEPYPNTEVRKKVVRQLGSDGWLGIGWPKEHGGKGLTPLEQYICFNVLYGYHYLPYPFDQYVISHVIMRYGTKEQKEWLLQPMLEGRLFTCGGFTEPSGGSDLASIKTTAVKDGDYYIINGQKSYTTMADYADVVFLLARTDPIAPKHHGITLFVFEMKTPGITVEPLITYGGHRTNYTFYDDVRVHKSAILGGEPNKGFTHMMAGFGFERVGLSCHARPQRVLEETTKWAKENVINGSPVIKLDWVQNKLIDMAIEIEVLKLFNYRAAWLATQGIVPRAEGSAQKFYGTELMQRCLGNALQIMSLFGQLLPGSKWVHFKGKFQTNFYVSVVGSIGGGVNEIQRDIVAWAGLGLPRSR